MVESAWVLRRAVPADPAALVVRLALDVVVLPAQRLAQRPVQARARVQDVAVRPVLRAIPPFWERRTRSASTAKRT